MVDPQALAEDSLIEEDFLVELKANGMSENTLKNYTSAIDTLRDLDKTPEEMEKKDLVKWSADVLDKYAESSQALFKTCVKRYFKWLINEDLNGDEYPDCVKWMKTNTNDKDLPPEILSHDEIKRMAETTKTQRNRTMIWTHYESGARPGELLSLKIRNLEFDKYGAKLMVDGKTGERRVRLIESVPDLKKWLSMHPDRDNPDAWLWSSRKGGKLSHSGWYYAVKKSRKSRK